MVQEGPGVVDGGSCMTGDVNLVPPLKVVREPQDVEGKEDSVGEEGKFR